MKKLTAEWCKCHIDSMKSNGMSLLEEKYLQALEIALPILEQQERGEDEWIEWGGAIHPANQYVEVKFRAGETLKEIARRLVWEHTGSNFDIIAYRIIPEQPTNQNGE